MIRVYACKLEQSFTEEQRHIAWDHMTTERKAKALRFRLLRAQDMGIAAGLMETYVISRELGIESKDITIEKGDQGKPYISGHKNAHYNISHSGDWIVCAWSDRPVGIDVEQSKKYSERVVRRFFHEEEIEDILQCDGENQLQAFVEYWTMKEAFMKLTGKGFSLPLDSFRTNRHTGEIVVLDSAPEDVKQTVQLDNKKNPVCQAVKLETGYGSCVCSYELESVELCMVSVEQMLDPATVEA